MSSASDGRSVSSPIPISLKQVAAWDLEYLNAPCDIQASVPALQRGLVWSPQQVELLWDSILRGFPIGSLVVCRPLDSQKRKGEEGRVINRHLLDGQQRCNAITLGFHDPFSDHGSQVRGNRSESILWLDLAPKKIPAISDTYDQIPNNSTRQFLTRVTTLAHPWGIRLTTAPAESVQGKLGRQLNRNLESERNSPPDLGHAISCLGVAMPRSRCLG